MSQFRHGTKTIHMHTLKLNLLVFALAMTVGACEKDSVTADESPVAAGNALRAKASSCAAFNYADSVYFIRNQASDYIVSPVKALAGTYGASPAGLSINPATGAINVSKSETGLRYTVFFVPAGTQDTCSRTVTVSGIDFTSAVYDLSKSNGLVKPTYRGRDESGMPCGTDGTCEFGDNNTLALGIGKKDAVIDLKSALGNGVFGNKPKNGTSRIYRIYYRINDASKKALNHIDVRFTYYSKMSDVPASLLNAVKAQNNPNARQIASPTTGTVLPVGFATAVSSGRPPDIIIVG